MRHQQDQVSLVRVSSPTSHAISELSPQVGNTPISRPTKWYVLFNMIWQLRSSSCFGVSPFSVPWVPTGINTGVFTGPCGRVKIDALALVVEHRARISNFRALFIDAEGNELVPQRSPILSSRQAGSESFFPTMPTIQIAYQRWCVSADRP